MKRFRLVLAASLMGMCGSELLAEELTLLGRSGADVVRLVGLEARQQLVVMAGQKDVTREVTFTCEPPEVVSVDGQGYLKPGSNGTALVVASHPGAEPVSIGVFVEQCEVSQPISFANDVVPVFTRNHCNAGACHAKATGQNGFQLSLLGYDPELDYEQLVRKSRGRRVFPASPESSLLLRKASGDLPHEGGARLDPQSADYRILHRWISSGMPYLADQDPVVERIEVLPEKVVAPPGAKQQLAVTAFFSDGTSRDITQAAQYESNQPEMATASETGLVSLAGDTGTTSVMVRFQEHMDVFQATIPLGHEVTNLPEPRNLIDNHIFAQLGLLGLPPSADCDDGTFLRRVTLDIAGRLPTLEESKEFLSDPSPHKRDRKIDALLDSSDYADFFAGKWAGLLRNKVARGTEWVTRDSYAFHAWIRTSFLANKPFDQFAGELVQASGKMIENPAVNWYRVVQDQKEQMQDIAQIFLGVRMQCAQCHHHPYEKWSQDDYYSFAAFFSTVARKNTRKLPEEDIVYHNRKAAGMKNPVTDEILKPKLLGSTGPLEIAVETDPRTELAKWLSDEENPFFARMLVNRYWKHFFGRALVEPEDDIRPTNPATHPELLEELAEFFIESGFDLKELIRLMCGSGTYQLSSLANDTNGEDQQNYARFYPRRLPAEVLLDSINDVTGARNSFGEMPDGARAIALPNEEGNKQSEFLTMFGRPQMDTACECERSSEANLGQSLHLINSDLIQAKLRSSGGRALALAKQTDRSDEDRLEELYLLALCRSPEEGELAIAKAHLKKKRDLSAEDPQKLSPARAEQEAFEDILWVVLNTKEFLFNH